MLTLLEPDAARITPADHAPAHDRAPEELALGTPLWLHDDLVEILGDAQVHSRVIDLVKYATDASPYRMFPKVVVTPANRRRDSQDLRLRAEEEASSNHSLRRFEPQWPVARRRHSDRWSKALGRDDGRGRRQAP